VAQTLLSMQRNGLLVDVAAWYGGKPKQLLSIDVARSSSWYRIFESKE
jgi:hypothetical protein